MHKLKSSILAVATILASFAITPAAHAAPPVCKQFDLKSGVCSLWVTPHQSIQEVAEVAQHLSAIRGASGRTRSGERGRRCLARMGSGSGRASTSATCHWRTLNRG
jgi:hypothetical protein